MRSFSLLRHRVHQVGLAEADAAVNEQRVVGFAGVAGDLNRGRLRELIALALDETVEGEVRVDGASEHRRRRPAAPCRGAAGGYRPRH